uniref:Zinc finger protein-like 1 homolog n=3 Tax=Clastoptera arizonana TaxID=38151 RepID=A0A1B6DE59_9HEMI
MFFYRKMGLCKCPKRRITNQFCYEHRVNVCEVCMVTKHTACTVQSYLKWLQDCDYDSLCTLCNKDLSSKSVVRLTCYHVFHWNCLDHYARKLPSTTAPAGYKCPTCQEPLFPKTNLVSPVGDVLRQKLAGVNWARVGLGLPLLSEEVDAVSNVDTQAVTPLDLSLDMINNSLTNSKDAIVYVEDPNTTINRTDNSGQQQSRRGYQTVDTPTTPPSVDVYDNDDNKYKRKSALYWFNRWLKSVGFGRRHSTGHFYQRYCMAAVLFIIVLTTIVVIFSKLGKIATADDSSFDEHNNPNIKIN